MALIFDMDGVIVDNHQWHFKAWVEFGKRHDIQITREDFSRHFGVTNQVIFKSMFGSSITEEASIRLANEKESIYRELYAPFIEPVKGLPAFMQQVYNSGIPIALATAAPSENVVFTLKATGLEKFFTAISDASMVTRSKPDPQVYLVTAEKLGITPSECLVFEDSIPGIQSAIAAGMEVIGVATTHKSAELLKYVNEIIMNFEAPLKQKSKFLRNINY
jgi:beta-phosphoglucomutase